MLRDTGDVGGVPFRGLQCWGETVYNFSRPDIDLKKPFPILKKTRCAYLRLFAGLVDLGISPFASGQFLDVLVFTGGGVNTLMHRAGVNPFFFCMPNPLQP